jgi:hypothetical protein
MVVAGLLLRFVFTPGSGETTAALGRGAWPYSGPVSTPWACFLLFNNHPLARTFAGLMA